MIPIEDSPPDTNPQPALQLPPSWAIGVWFWTGGNRTLAIGGNGIVTVNVNGQGYSGVYDGSNNTIFLNGDTSDVQPIANGIQTYNRSNGEYSNYLSNIIPVAPVNNPTIPDTPPIIVQPTPQPIPVPIPTVTLPPSWTIGTWYWTQGNRVLNINGDGSVSVGGYSGTYNGNDNTIFLNGDVSDVTQTSNGIRTYNRTNGEYSDYMMNPADEVILPADNNPLECFWGTPYQVNGVWTCPSIFGVGTLPPATTNTQDDTGGTNPNAQTETQTGSASTTNTTNTQVNQNQVVADAQTFIQQNPYVVLGAIGLLAYLFLRK